MKLVSIVLLPALIAAAPTGQTIRTTQPAPAATTTAGAGTTATTAGAANEFASFGVSFTPPPAAAWRRIVEGGTGMIARWARIGAGGKANALMTIEMEPANARSAEAYAAAVAKRAGGTATPSKVAIGGEPAWHVAGLKRGEMTVEMLVTLRGKYLYLVTAFGDASELVPRAEAEALARSVKFAELADPSKHVVMRNDRFPIFENRFTIVPLANMRPNPGPPAEGSVGVSTFNFAAGRPDFIANIQLLPNDARAPMAAVQAQFPGKLAPGKQVTWTKLPGDGPVERTISSTFEAQLGPASQKTRVAVVRLSESEVVLILYSFAVTDPAAIVAYEKASEQMTQSVTPVGG